VGAYSLNLHFDWIHRAGAEKTFVQFLRSHLPPLTQRIPDHEIASYIPANGVVLINCGNCEVIQQRHRQQNSAFQQTKPSPEVHPTNNFERLRSSPGRRNSDAETKRRRDSLRLESI
jgi:hypothetical protein